MESYVVTGLWRNVKERDLEIERDTGLLRDGARGEVSMSFPPADV